MTAATDLPVIEDVGPADLRDAVSDAIGRSDVFCGAYAHRAGAVQRFSIVWARGNQTRLTVCSTTSGVLQSIVDIVPAAAWDEREAADLYGLRFDGHVPCRPLARHPDDLSAWTTEVQGDGVHQVAVGPIHAGVIESGHFRFHVVGERILHVDLQLFYKHRGLEAAAEGGDLAGALVLAGRACGADAASNSVACATAIEQLTGLWPSVEVRRARTLLVELERLYNHFNDISAVCAGVGFAAGAMAFAALKERAMRVNERLAGHRFLFNAVRVGGSDLDVGDADASAFSETLTDLGRDFERAWRDLSFSAPFRARLGDVGVLEPADAGELGAVGPAARASGLRIDARTNAPRLYYPTDFRPALPSSPSGDVEARLELRALELRDTLSMLDDLLIAPIRPSTCDVRGRTGTIGVGLVESPRGRTLCAVEAHNGTVGRLHLRTGSYANWPSLAHATAGNILPDFPLINKSFELCYACVDR